MRIPELITDQALRDAVKLLVDDAKQKTQFARDWRNRRLAHHELPALEGQVGAPVPQASRYDIESALSAIQAAMNHIERHFLNQTVRYDLTIEPLGGVKSLIARIQAGVEAEEAERERRLRGQ